MMTTEVVPCRASVQHGLVSPECSCTGYLTLAFTQVPFCFYHLFSFQMASSFRVFSFAGIPLLRIGRVTRSETSRGELHGRWIVSCCRCGRENSTVRALTRSVPAPTIDKVTACHRERPRSPDHAPGRSRGLSPTSHSRARAVGSAYIGQRRRRQYKRVGTAPRHSSIVTLTVAHRTQPPPPEPSEVPATVATCQTRPRISSR